MSIENWIGFVGESGTGDVNEDSPMLGRRQRLFVGLGVLCVLVGLATPFALGTASGSGPVLFAIALVALGLGCRYAYLRVGEGVTQGEPPAVEGRPDLAYTGQSFERSAREADSDVEWRRGRGRETVKRRLRSLVTAVVVDRDGGTETEAREALEDGTWTDDRTAAALFSEESRRFGFLRPTPPVSERAVSVVDELADAVLGGGERTGRWLDVPIDSDRECWRHGRRSTGRWQGVGGLGLVALALAAFARKPALVLLAATLFGMAGYARLGTAPTPSLAVERAIETTAPWPGDHVTVDVTVRNAGETVLPDLRFVDGVPDDLAVVDGSARHATALRPGEETTFSYDVLAVYGDHEFDKLHVMSRDTSAGEELTTTVADGAATLTCEPRAVRESVPLHPQASGVVGRVPSDVGGSGHEFYAVREYRRGDPLGRIDWNRLARTGALATLQFREEHAATVALLVDARSDARRAPGPETLSTLDRSLAGAAQVYGSLRADGDRVGLASVGVDWTWVQPGAGTDHQTRFQSQLQSIRDAETGSRRGSFVTERYVRQLRRHLPSDAQIILFSPLLDDESVALARRLHAFGHSVTVFSPDPTSTASVGGVLVRVERTLALSSLRGTGVPVVDWHIDEPLPVAVERASRRWRR